VENSLQDPLASLFIRNRHRTSVLSRTASEDVDALSSSVQWKDEWLADLSPIWLRIYVLVSLFSQSSTHILFLPPQGPSD